MRNLSLKVGSVAAPELRYCPQSTLPMNRCRQWFTEIDIADKPIGGGNTPRWAGIVAKSPPGHQPGRAHLPLTSGDRQA